MNQPVDSREHTGQQIDETPVMMALTMLTERGLLPSQDYSWARATLAERQAEGALRQSVLAQAASLVNRHAAIAREHGIPVPPLPGATAPGPRETGAPRPGAKQCEIVVANSGELMVTGTPYEMRDALKSLPGHRYSRSEKAWYFTASPAVAAMVGTLIMNHSLPLAMGERAKALAVEHTRRRETAQVLDPDSAVPQLAWEGVATREPWEHQLRGAEFMMASSAACIGAPMGPQPVGTPVLTPKGWRTLGDLAPGDEVYGSDGRAATITGTTAHGAQPVYRVTLSDGSSTRATGDHRWAVRTQDGHESVRTTDELRLIGTHRAPTSGRARGNRRWRLPESPVVAMSGPGGAIPAYAMGALLGDGHIGPGASLYNLDTDIHDRVARELTATFNVSHVMQHRQTCIVSRFVADRGGSRCFNELHIALRDLGVWGKRARDKHVPIEYLHAHEDVRRDMLAGLLDTDGTAVQHGVAEFVTISTQLAADVAFLARSLGMVAMDADRTDGARVVRVWHRPGQHGPFWCVRKATTSEERSRATASPKARVIDSIEPDGIAPVCCIELADTDDRLYLTDSTLIPTHNSGKTAMSYLAMNLMEVRRVLVVCPNPVRGVWGREAGRHSVRPWHVVDGRRRSTRARSGWVDLQVADRMRQGEEALYDCRCGKPHMMVINYEILTHENFDGWAPRARFETILYDEVHRLGSHTEKTKGGGLGVSGRAGSWVGLADHRWGLSGTPIGTDPAENLFGEYRALDPGIFGTVWTSKMNAADGLPRGHSERYQIFNPQVRNHVIGYRNLADLARKASVIMYRPSVQLDLPPSTTETVEVTLDAPTMKAYRQMETELVADLAEHIDPGSPAAIEAMRARVQREVRRDEALRRDVSTVDPAKLQARIDSIVAARLDDPETMTTAPNPMVKLLRLQQLTGGVLATDDGVEARVWDTGKGGTKPSPKGEALGEALSMVGCTTALTELDEHGWLVEKAPEPVVVFCRFSSDLAQVREVVEARGLRYAEISGKRKDGLAADSTMAPDCDVVGVQIQAGGTGIELVRARVVVWWSVGYSLVDFDQAVKRVHRPGQTRPVLNIHLVAVGTADEAVYEALNERRSTVASFYQLAGFRDEQVDALTAATTATAAGEVEDGVSERVDRLDVPDLDDPVSSLHAGLVQADLPFIDQADRLGNADVYKPRKRKRRTGAPTQKGRGRGGSGPGRDQGRGPSREEFGDSPDGIGSTDRAEQLDAMQDALWE